MGIAGIPPDGMPKGNIGGGIGPPSNLGMSKGIMGAISGGA